MRKNAKWASVAALSLMVAAGCTTTPEPPRPSEQGPSPVAPQADAAIEPLSAAQWTRIRAAGMVRPECPIQERAQLRSVRVNFHGFDGKVKRGQLVVNADVADSVARIFTRLFELNFSIRRMRPVETFDGDTNVSLRADNTSAFNCRRADQINAPFAESPHANGRAVDINPRENPWLDLRCRCWIPTAETKQRVPGEGVILRGGDVWKVFKREGWVWQNIDVPDYMHFDTGYPSRPYRRPTGR